MALLQRIFVLCLLAAAGSAPALAQTPEAPKKLPPVLAAEYPNSEEGLRTELQDVLKASKNKNPEKLKSALADLEIPDYEGWFEKNFDGNVQKFWAGSYRRALRGENNFAVIFTVLARRDGDFKFRKVNGSPTTRIEEVFTDKMKNPVDVFAVSWQRKNATETTGEQLLGYYFFLDRKFRWFYMLDFPKNQGPASPGGETSKSEPKVPAAGKPGTTPPSSQPK
jgi:hypothetical protein